MDITVISPPQVLRLTPTGRPEIKAAVAASTAVAPSPDVLSLVKQGVSTQTIITFAEEALPALARDPRAFGMTGVMTNLLGEPVTNKMGNRWTGTAIGAAIGVGIGVVFGSAVGLRSLFLAQEALGGCLAGAATGFASSGPSARRQAMMMR